MQNFILYFIYHLLVQAKFLEALNEKKKASGRDLIIPWPWNILQEISDLCAEMRCEPKAAPRGNVVVRKSTHRES